MPSRTHSTSPSKPTPPNAFTPTYLEHLQANTEEPLTAAESDLAGPWKLEPVPGHPGAVAVLREWESLDAGDVPVAVCLHRETAALLAAVLPVLGREPLFHLEEDPDPDPSGPLPGGFPLVAVFGEQGPAVSGWLQIYQPEIVQALHLVEGLIRQPRSLAEVNAAAGGGALAQVGRYLAARGMD
jgi:hypothetical protein